MVETYKLNTGVEIPSVGFGTWRIPDGEEAVQAVLDAITTGYRLIDTAKVYGNESSVGKAIKESGVSRSDIFLTTKLWNDDQGYHSARAAFDASLERLGMEYVDLYLIHWPATDERHKAWRALEELYEEGLAKAIGVSNYEVWHLEELLERSETVPAVNQIEFHPFNYKKQKPTLDFCKEKGIIVEAWSPLTHGEKMDDAVVTEIAKKHKKTNAQVLLRWCLQHGTLPLPKSLNTAHMSDNIEIFGFELSDTDMDELNRLSN